MDEERRDGERPEPACRPEYKAERKGTPKKWTDFFKGKQGQRLILTAGAVGIGLILLSQFWPEKQAAPATAQLSAEEFVAKTEEKLKTIVGSIEGAGQCQVMVTLENGVEYVYASQQKVNSDRVEDTGENSNKLQQRDDTEQNIIIVDTQDGRQGLLVTEIQPTVKGVVVVCEGGDQALVQKRITDAITTALNISSKRVCVSKLS